MKAWILHRISEVALPNSTGICTSIHCSIFWTVESFPEFLKITHSSNNSKVEKEKVHLQISLILCLIFLIHILVVISGYKTFILIFCRKTCVRIQSGLITGTSSFIFWAFGLVLEPFFRKLSDRMKQSKHTLLERIP